MCTPCVCVFTDTNTPVLMTLLHRLSALLVFGSCNFSLLISPVKHFK